MNDKFFCTAKTDIGRKYNHNEDFYYLPAPCEKFKISFESIEKKGNLYILCDGMGGAKSGEVASELSCGWLAGEFYTKDDLDSKKKSCKILKEIISGINSKIYKLAKEHDQYTGMCTTIVAAHIDGNNLSVCSVGDSRAYLYRDKKFTQLTEDQSAVWSLYKDGSITKEELRHHPRNHILLRAIGSDEVLGASDIFYCEEKLKNGDILMLCSDGLSDMVGDADIEKVLSQENCIEKKAGRLVDMANENGGKDNITVVLVEVCIAG